MIALLLQEQILEILMNNNKNVRPEGLEPSTFGTGIQRSIQLNYGRINSTFEPVKLVINSQFCAIQPPIN